MKKKKTSGVLGGMLAKISQQELKRTQNRMLLAAKIYEAMREKNLTQKELAAKMGKNESEISDWLSGDRNFTVDTLTDISEVLEIQLLNTAYMKLYTACNESISLESSKSSGVEFAKQKCWNMTGSGLVTTKKKLTVKIA